MATRPSAAATTGLLSLTFDVLLCLPTTQQERRPHIRLTVTMERRGDDGLYVYCDELPGFVLSHSDPEAVLADIAPA
jgi:hypothetical protein